MEIRSEELKEEINTVYFRGGTPSLIESEAIASMLNQAKKYFKIAPDAELNPLLQRSPRVLRSQLTRL